MEDKAQYATAANLNARIRLHENYSTNKIGFHEWVFNILDLKEEYNVLECGCGPGALWYKNASKIKSKNITLFDLSPGMLEEAKRNTSGIKNVNFKYICGDVQKLPFIDGTFDVVIANHMLYHVPDIDLALREFNRVLKHNGKFFSSTFGEDHLKELDELTRKFVDMPKKRTSDRFTLENGCYRILKEFRNLKLYLHDDSLIVTNEKDLINYVMSGSYAQKQLTGDNYKLFENYVSSLFKSNHSFNVQKNAGLFMSLKD